MAVTRAGRGHRAGTTAEDARCLVFLHMPKTAGSTLTTVLRWQYRDLHPSQLVRLEPRDEAAAAIEGLDPERRRRLRVVMGHFPYGLHEHLPVPCSYITIVRDPVRRVLSSYRFARSSPSHPLHDEMRGSSMTLERYVTSGVDRGQVENGLTRQLAGVGERDPAEITERHLDAAVGHLRTFAAVGLTERFDESLILFRRTLGWSTPFYFSRNVSSPAPRDHVPDRVLEHIRDRTALDRRLYEHAQRLFEAGVRAQGDGFEREVRRFHRLNAAPRALRRALEPIAPFVRRGLEWRAAHRAPTG